MECVSGKASQNPTQFQFRINGLIDYALCVRLLLLKALEVYPFL